ncbi:MAG: hypothetical protein V4631_14195 [Pseudomonadota bacterium]
MDRSHKAALLSALVFPGAGQFFLQRRLVGWLFAVPTVAAALQLLTVVYARAQQIADDLVAGRIDLFQVLGRVHEQGLIAGPAANIAAYVMVACWIGSIAHAWLAGRAPAA